MSHNNSQLASETLSVSELRAGFTELQNNPFYKRVMTVISQRMAAQRAAIYCGVEQFGDFLVREQAIGALLELERVPMIVTEILAELDSAQQ